MTIAQHRLLQTACIEVAQKLGVPLHKRLIFYRLIAHSEISFVIVMPDTVT